MMSAQIADRARQHHKFGIAECATERKRAREGGGGAGGTLMGCSVPPRIEQPSNRIVMSHSDESYAADHQYPIELTKIR